MQEKNFELYEYAKRVNEFSPKKAIVYLNPKPKLKGMKLPSMEFSLENGEKEMTPISPMKNPKQMNVSEFSSKRVSCVRSAYAAYKCCQNQDLHLFQFEKIYLEKKFILKGVAQWKLPKRKLVQQQLKTLTEGLKFNSSNYRNHLITWIAHLKKSDEDKGVRDQLELQKQGKEKRNYSVNKPVF